MVADGQILGERYRVEHLIGSGRFASVYAATDTWNSTTLALKVFRPSTDRRTVVGERFFRRTKLAMSSPHPVIVPIKDSGRTSEGVPFLVMELLEGITIDGEVESHGALPFAKGLFIAQAMLEGLAAAHAEGYVHRNINPSNVFLVASESAQPTVRILDFGVAQDLVDYLAIAPSAIGSTRYLAPELLLDTDRAWSPAVDVFAAGTVLFLMLTGRLPFDKEIYVGKGKNTINAYASIFKLPGPSEFAPHVPRSIDDVVQKSLAIEQWERYKNAREMLDALDLALSNVELSQLDTAQAEPQYHQTAHEQWFQDTQTDEDLTTPGDISAAVHAYTEHRRPDTPLAASRTVPESSGKDITDAVNAFMDLFSPNAQPFPDLDGHEQYDPTKKVLLPEMDEDRTLDSAPPQPILDGNGGPRTIKMDDIGGFDELQTQGPADGAKDETLDQPLNERARLLLDQDGGIETPIKVLEKLYAAGVDINTTLVDPSVEEGVVEEMASSAHQLLLVDDDDDDDITETKPLPVQPKHQVLQKFPVDLEHYDATKKMYLPDADHSPAPPQMPAPAASSSSAPPQIAIPTRKQILVRGRQHRLSSANVGAHFPDLRRRKIVGRILVATGIAILVSVLLFIALVGVSRCT